VLFLLTTKYMSLSTMLAMLSGLVYLLIAGVDTPAVLWLFGAQVLFLIVRHKENIKRLVSGTEKKFSFKSKASA